MDMLSNWRCLSQVVLYSNLFYLVLPLLSQYLLPTYSLENSLVVSRTSPLYHTISFDGVHFLTNDYVYEKNYAFLPGFTLWVRLVLRLCSPQTGILLVVITNKICTALGAVVLMNLTTLMTKNKKVGRLSGTLFLFNPAGMFYHAVYSEAIYSLIVFAGIHRYYQVESRPPTQDMDAFSYMRRYWHSLVLLSLSTIFRTTGVFLCLIYGIPILERLCGQIVNKKISKAADTTLTGVLVLACFLTLPTIYLIAGRNQFCGQLRLQPAFCQWTIPNVYSYIQDKFWQVGFLSYFRPQSTLFIIIGLPSIVIALLTTTNSGDFGLDLSYWILLFVTVCYSNVQSSARFFSSHPLYCIGLARGLSIRGKSTLLQKSIVVYLILYSYLGVIMFPVRFPWT